MGRPLLQLGSWEGWNIPDYFLYVQFTEKAGQVIVFSTKLNITLRSLATTVNFSSKHLKY